MDDAPYFNEMDLSIAPVAIASRSLDTLECGLMHYPGRALAVDLWAGDRNGCDGADEAQACANSQAVQALARKYGAACIPAEQLNLCV